MTIKSPSNSEILLLQMGVIDLYHKSKIALVRIGLDQQGPTSWKFSETSEKRQIVKDQTN